MAVTERQKLQGDLRTGVIDLGLINLIVENLTDEQIEGARLALKLNRQREESLRLVDKYTKFYEKEPEFDWKIKSVDLIVRVLELSQDQRISLRTMTHVFEYSGMFNVKHVVPFEFGGVVDLKFNSDDMKDVLVDMDDNGDILYVSPDLKIELGIK